MDVEKTHDFSEDRVYSRESFYRDYALYFLKYKTSFAFTRFAVGPDFVKWLAWSLFLGVVGELLPCIFPTMASSGVAADRLASL